jgi:hypothetical protein
MNSNKTCMTVMITRTVGVSLIDGWPSICILVPTRTGATSSGMGTSPQRLMGTQCLRSSGMHSSSALAVGVGASSSCWSHWVGGGDRCSACWFDRHGCYADEGAVAACAISSHSYRYYNVIMHWHPDHT